MRALEEQQDTIGIFYDKELNAFTDEDGFIIWYIFEFITPNDVYLFKKNKEYMIVPCQCLPGTYCELFYPDQDLDSDPYFRHLAYIEEQLFERRNR